MRHRTGSRPTSRTVCDKRQCVSVGGPVSLAMRAPAGRASDMDIGEPPCLHVPLAACRSMKSVTTGTGNPVWSGCNMPSPKPGRSPACGPHVKINTSSSTFPQRFRRSRCHRRGHGWHCPCRGVPRGQNPVFIRAPRSPAGLGRRGKAGFGQAGADRSGFKRPVPPRSTSPGRLHRRGRRPGSTGAGPVRAHWPPWEDTSPACPSSSAGTSSRFPEPGSRPRSPGACCRWAR